MLKIEDNVVDPDYEGPSSNESDFLSGWPWKDLKPLKSLLYKGKII